MARNSLERTRLGAFTPGLGGHIDHTAQSSAGGGETLGSNYRYFLNVLAVTATLSAKSVANGSTINVGCKLNGKAR